MFVRARYSQYGAEPYGDVVMVNSRYVRTIWRRTDGKALLELEGGKSVFISEDPFEKVVHGDPAPAQAAD